MPQADTPSSATPSRQALTRRLGLSVAWGFAVLLALMAALILHAVWHIGHLEARMRAIVETLNLKIQLTTDLQEATYNRHASLVYQTLLADPFERDESFQLYIKWGYHVGKARSDLKALPLDAFERDNLRQQDALVARIIVLHETIADLAARGEVSPAHALMTRALRPLNLEFTDTVERLRRHERDQIRAALLDTQAATRQAVHFHLALGALALLLAGLIALATRRLMKRHAGTIHAQMTELEQASDRLAHEATHDALTGLANRALFQRRMAESLEHARQDGFQMGVMYLDLDDFKQVNDSHGHAVGDALLREVALRLRQVVRVSDTVARLGGDEFAILLTGLEDPDQCAAMKRKIERELARPALLEDVPLTPGGSLGCVLYPRDGETLERLLKAADARMYAVKRARKAGR